MKTWQVLKMYHNGTWQVIKTEDEATPYRIYCTYYEFGNKHKKLIQKYANLYMCLWYLETVVGNQ